MHLNLFLHIKTLLHKWVWFFKMSKTANLQYSKHIIFLFVWESASQQTADKNPIRLALIKTFFYIKTILFFKQYGKKLKKKLKNNRFQCLFKTYRISKQKVNVKDFIMCITHFTVCLNIAWTTLLHTFFPFFWFLTLCWCEKIN